MRPQHGEAGDVPVAGLGVRIFFQLGEDVTDDPSVVVLGHPKELRPREHVVEVVLHLVVLRKAPQVGLLHVGEVVHGRHADAHHGWQAPEFRRYARADGGRYIGAAGDGVAGMGWNRGARASANGRGSYARAGKVQLTGLQTSDRLTPLPCYAQCAWYFGRHSLILARVCIRVLYIILIHTTR